MDRAALAARHHAAVTRWARQLDDEGRVPAGLLAELARIADEHAADAAMAAVAARTATHSAAGPPDTESPPPAPAPPPKARTAPRSRTSTRTRTT